MTIIKLFDCAKIIGNIPIRLYVGLMIFVSCVMSYMLRTNLSINILAMVYPTGSSAASRMPNLVGSTTPASATVNSTDSFIPTTMTPRDAAVLDYGERFAWSDQQVSSLLGAYFWGYLFSTLIGGFLADKFGAATVILFTMALTCITTAFVPLGAHAGFMYIYILRFLTGAFGGPLYPALQNLTAQWAPPAEKGKFMSAMMGGNFGTVITWPLVGIIIESIGWVYGFYIPAILMALTAFVWWYNVTDTPKQHPRIKEAEKKYIEDSFQGHVSAKKGSLPLLQLAKSVPFWSLLLLHYGSLWGVYFLLTAAPKFMNEVLGFNLTKAGFLAAVPYLARMVCAFIFGSIGDVILARKLLSVTHLRKVFCIFSHVLPGLLLLSISLVGHQPYWCVAIISLSLGFNGSSALTNMQNGQDLAPNFAGSIYSLINFVGTTSGFLTPMVVVFFTRDGNSIENWNNVFLLGSIMYIVPAIVFMFFGSGEVQPWNEPDWSVATDNGANVEAKLPEKKTPTATMTPTTTVKTTAEKTSVTRL